ncbi:MAG: flippase, partial [Lactobacillus delbrueckii]
VYIGKVIWKKLIAGTLMMLVILALNPFGNPGIIKLGIQFVLGAGTYLATLFIMKDDSVGLLKKILGRG